MQERPRSRKRKRKAGVDKNLYSFSTRDAFIDYHLKHSHEEKVDRVMWNRVTDSLIEKVSTKVLEDRQIFKPLGGIGKFQMVKDKIETSAHKFGNVNKLLTDGWVFFLYWYKEGKEAPQFPNKKIYKLRAVKSYRKKISKHVIDLAEDPYKKDYTTIINPKSHLFWT